MIFERFLGKGVITYLMGMFNFSSTVHEDAWSYVFSISAYPYQLPISLSYRALVAKFLFVQYLFCSIFVLLT